MKSNKDPMSQMQAASDALLSLLLSNLCQYPENSDVSIIINGTQSCLICLSVDPRDYGKVIGQQGKIIKATRTLLKAFAGKYRVRFLFEITEKT